MEKLVDNMQKMRQPIRAVETFVSWLDVNLLQFDQSASSIGESPAAHCYRVFYTSVCICL